MWQTQSSAQGAAESSVEEKSGHLVSGLGNLMNGNRSFVIASILCLHDTCFLYPACHKCGSRLLLNLGRFHCPKDASESTTENTNYRYRLSVKAARENEIFNITVFGSCLEPYFGTTAGCLHRCHALRGHWRPWTSVDWSIIMFGKIPQWYAIAFCSMADQETLPHIIPCHQMYWKNLLTDNQPVWQVMNLLWPSGPEIRPDYSEGQTGRYCEDLKKKLQTSEGEKVQDFLIQAVEHCFIGRSFIFGLKASEFLPGILSSANPLQTTINKNKSKKHLVACQIAVPNTAVYGCTVFNYYKELLGLGGIQTLSPLSLLSDSPFIAVNQSSNMIKSLTSLLSGNTQSFTQLNDVNRLSNPWLQDFALALSSVDCITIEEFSTAETSRICSKWSISRPCHVEEASQNGKDHKSILSAFSTPVSQNSCSTNIMVRLPSSLKVQRLSANDCTSQCYSTSFDELQEDCFKSHFNMQRCCMQKPEDSLTNGKDRDEFQPADKSYCLLEDSMDDSDATLWDDLVFSESLDEFIAKVEANQQRCDEKAALLTDVTAVGDSVHSCSLQKLKTDYIPNGTRRQNSRIRDVCTDSTNCNLTGTRKNYCDDSNNPKGLLNEVVDGFKSDDTTGKEVHLATALPLRSVDGSIPSDVQTPSQEAVMQICSIFVSPISAGNCSTKCTPMCRFDSHNVEKQMGEYSSFLSACKATEVNKLTDPSYTTNESCLLGDFDFQTLFPSAKQLLKVKDKIHNEFQNQICIKGCYVDACDIKAASRLSPTFNLYQNISFQNMSFNSTEQGYDISGDLFNDSGGNKEEPSICLKTNMCILSKPVSTPKALNETNYKLNEQQSNISLCCLNGAAGSVEKNNNSPENDSLNLFEHDFSDSRDFVPFSQSTPVSRFQSLKLFRGRESKPLKMAPYVRPSTRPAAFRQRQNDQPKQQSLPIQNMFQLPSRRNQTSMPLNSSLLSNSTISKSESDSDEWIPPSTTKTRIMSSHLSCAFNINKSRGVKLFTHVSYANAAMETADSKATSEGNKENDSSNQCRGNLYMKKATCRKAYQTIITAKSIQLNKGCSEQNRKTRVPCF
ncbi:DNA damage-induced apoptosis suppressor protein isoform X3 [Scyliorhinus canicula]|nr:DNA damage-induced apoptosis suppressor protein isoform X3 [Scyliorhinus canicula]